MELRHLGIELDGHANTVREHGPGNRFDRRLLWRADCSVTTRPDERRSAILGDAPGLDSRAVSRLRRALHEIELVVPRDRQFALLDQAALGNVSLAGRSAVRFIERDGRYFGLPSDDANAIRP